MVDQKSMFRIDGSYDFKKREDWDYKHNYDYMADLIEKTARYIHKSSDPNIFERTVQEKNKGKPDWQFLDLGGDGHDYYRFVRHCLEREVNPRPLAEQARRVKEDRDKKQANARNNVMTAGMGSEPTLPQLKEAAFKAGELMEVVGLKNAPDYNGKIVRIVKYHPDVDRYEVKFEGG